MQHPTPFGPPTRTRIVELPKAELHVHIEGTLTPERLIALSERHGISLPYRSIQEVQAAYRFDDLQSFLNLYYRGAAVLREEDDFYELMADYLTTAAADGVVRAEIFFDPQTHLERGIPFETFMAGFDRALTEARGRGMSADLIMCFLRDKPVSEAWDVWREAQNHLDAIIGVGLDSAEVGHPPAAFSGLFAEAAASGLHRVAHAGEEGPPQYIWSALDDLGAERIDHGVRAEEDDALVERLASESTPLTMCPLSNLKLKVVDDLRNHNLRRLLDRGLRVTVNSDDPAYFGGHIADNFVACVAELDLSDGDVVQLCRNSIEASFAPVAEKANWLATLPGQ